MKIVDGLIRLYSETLCFLLGHKDFVSETKGWCYCLRCHKYGAIMHVGMSLNKKLVFWGKSLDKE